MNRLATSLLAVGLLAAGTASAQSGYYPSQSYPPPDAGRYERDAQYDVARVVRVDPVIVSGYRGGSTTTGQRCHSRQDGYYAGDGRYGDGGYQDDGYRDDGYRDGRYEPGYRSGSEAGRNVATVVGGVVGAVLGSKVGGGSARYATAAVGSMVGGMAGRKVYDNSHAPPRAGVVTVCEPVSAVYPPAGDYYAVDDERVGAYDVTYEYAGRQYTTRMDHHPGDSLRVRVDVSPAE
ncbi:MAG TPA: glycine zipper 2TM domain-containing protein [Luteimonas sp.]|nr:glycine zipper 2TM domain-containing protein [Luteimonas sp.]